MIGRIENMIPANIAPNPVQAVGTFVVMSFVLNGLSQFPAVKDMDYTGLTVCLQAYSSKYPAGSVALRQCV